MEQFIKFKHYKVDRDYLRKVFFVSNAIVLVMLGINPMLGSNYWYISQIPAVHPLIEQLPWWAYIALAETVFVILLILLGKCFKSWIKEKAQN